MPLPPLPDPVITAALRDIQSSQQQNAASLGSMRETMAAQNAELRAQNTELKAQNVELKRISRQLNALGVQVDALHGSFATLTTSSIPPSANSRSARHARASSARRSEHVSRVDPPPIKPEPAGPLPKPVGPVSVGGAPLAPSGGV